LTGSRPRVCFVLDAFAPQVGGVEREFFEFSRRLVSLGWDVSVLTSASSGGSGRTCMDGVTVEYFPWRDLAGHPLPRPRDLDRWVAGCDIVHTTTYSSAPAALRVSRRHGKPCILTVQECLGRKWFWVEPRLRAAVFLIYERRLVTRPFTAYHAISEATRRDLVRAGVDGRLVTTIHLGVDERLWNPDVSPRDLNALLGFPSGCRVFLFTGRPGPTKGAHLLLDAIETAGTQMPADVRFGFIMSAHPPGARDAFVREVGRRGLRDLVSVRPSVGYDELPGYVRAAASIVVPSMTEGFGFCAAEASALGVPLVTSDAGSLPEVVSGRHLAFRNRDSADLAAKLLYAATGRFRQRDRRVFSWDVATAGLAGLYAEVLGDPSLAPESKR